MSFDNKHTTVTTAAYERPEANKKVGKNAPESVDTPLKDTP